MIANARNRFTYPMGTELTAIPRQYKERGQDRIDFDALAEKMEQYLKNRRRAFDHCSPDGHCIEIASKKLWTMEQAESFSKGIRELFEANDCAPKHPDAVCGGAHIHVGIEDPRIRVRIWRHLIGCYYLPWVFGEPDDTDSMNNLITNITFYGQYLLRDRMGGQSQWNYGICGAIADCVLPEKRLTDKKIKRIIYATENHKDHLARMTENTLECRFMEMAPTWEEQKLQLTFVDKYMKWATGMAQNPDWGKERLIGLMMTPENFQHITADVAEERFTDLCLAIGARVEDYEVFIKRNLRPRWRRDRKRT